MLMVKKYTVVAILEARPTLIDLIEPINSLH